MDNDSSKSSSKKSPKIFIIIASIVFVVGIIICLIFLLPSIINDNSSVSYSDDPELFCKNNPEHALCSGEEISYWDDPVNFCLKFPDDEGCEKKGEPDYCKKNPSSVLCDKDPNNDYDWVDDYVDAAFESHSNDDGAIKIRDFMSDSFKDLVECVNSAGFHVDSYESLQQIADQDILAEKYNSAQLRKVTVCGEQFMNDFTDK